MSLVMRAARSGLSGSQAVMCAAGQAVARVCVDSPVPAPRSIAVSGSSVSGVLLVSLLVSSLFSF